MLDRALRERVAHLLDLRDAEAINVLGPTIRFLAQPEDGAPCVMQGTIPPGGIVPLHSHADPETFLHISGEVEGLSQSPEGFIWVRIQPGDIFYVPGGAKHAFRNRSAEPAVSIVVSTAKIGRFFQEIGTPVAPGHRSRSGPPTAEAIRHFLRVADNYGYWNATPEENASVGLSL